MSNIENNPPAFQVNTTGQMEPSGGMSLRDYFAIHGPQPSVEAIATQESLDRARNPHNDSYKPRIRSRDEVVSYLRYRQADAMLAERQQEPPADPKMQRVAYVDEGEFQWISGIRPRDCELFAKMVSA